MITKPEKTYGCEHYSRKCKLVSPCCDTVYTCRLCHDDEQFYPVFDPKQKHKLDRFKVQEVVCINCNEKQPVSNNCNKCGITFGNYFCDICNLFDDTDKGQYHCDKCGFCRIGGKDNFIHCDSCHMCIGKDIFNIHKCVQIKESLCSICMTDLYTSTDKITQLLCGHYIHITCLFEYLKSNYKCPICSKSIVETNKLNEYLDREISITPMPPEYINVKFNILCNDCHTESNTNFHVVGLKCGECGGYNTRRI